MDERTENPFLIFQFDKETQPSTLQCPVKLLLSTFRFAFRRLVTVLTIVESDQIFSREHQRLQPYQLSPAEFDYGLTVHYQKPHRIDQNQPSDNSQDNRKDALLSQFLL